jgi:hypothetical protein
MTRSDQRGNKPLELSHLWTLSQITRGEDGLDLSQFIIVYVRND